MMGDLSDQSAARRWVEMIVPGLVVGLITAAMSSYGMFLVMDYRLKTLETNFKSYAEKVEQVPLNRQRLERVERDVVELRSRLDAVERESRRMERRGE